MPLKGAGNSDPSRLSRKHIWEQSDGFFSLFGGKLTTYAWTAAEGLRLVAAFLRRKCSVTTLVDRKLDAKRAIDLFGRSDMDVIAAARHCIEYEQVEYLEDLMRRRLGLELLPGHGEQHLHTLVELLKQHFPDRAEAKHDWEGQANEYRERVRRIQQLVAIA